MQSQPDAENIGQLGPLTASWRLCVTSSTAETVARRLKDSIRNQVGLTASVGLAPNKSLAKLASDMQKPDGLVVIRTDDVDRILLPMPVTKLWGIGKATASKLAGVGIRAVALQSEWHSGLSLFLRNGDQRENG